MKKRFFDNYLNILLFITATVLIFSVVFTLITGMSPLEALNVSPLAATIGLVVLVAMFITIPIIVNRLGGRE